MRISTFLLVCALALSGCARMEYSRPGLSEGQFRADIYQCEREAAGMYQTAMVQTAIGGYQAPDQTTCRVYGSTADCSTSHGASMPPVIIASDMNAGNRAGATQSCMAARGYSYGRASSGPSGNLPTPDAIGEAIQEGKRAP